MRLRKCVAALVACSISAVAAQAWGQTETGSSLALKSSGAAASNSGWTLSSDGYVGTYIQLSTPTAVTLTADALDASAGTAAPDMTFSIANDTDSQTVSATTSSAYAYTTPVLPAGTYFIRTQLDNSVSGAAGAPALTVASLGVSGTGVTVLNSNTSTNALNAATTYADNFRSGNAVVKLVMPNGQPVPAGTAAHVQLTSNAFNFALAVDGQSPTDENENGGTTGWLNYNSSTGAYIAPTAGTTAALFQQHLLQNFNMIVPTNAGKWQNNEYTQGSVNMTLVNAMSDFAAANGLGMRMHNLIWYNQQPSFINTDFSNKNYSAISSALTNRINYYVSQDNPNLGTPRTDSYQEMDVLNEPLHGQSGTDNYVGAYGISGIASIYNQVAQAVAASGGNTRLYSNEYNVLQNSPASINSSGVQSGSDPYANWYLNYITQVNNAGYGKVLTGVGSELYVYYTSSNYNSSGGALSPATMQQALQNLAVAGDPISLTEFGVSSSGSTPTPTAFAADLTTALTMMYGDPQATTFGFWGGLGGLVDANSVTSLYDSNWNLTAVGEAYQQWMSQWETNLNLTTDANGDLDFNGTYGMYDVTIDGQTYSFDFTADGASQLTLVVPEPASGAALVALFALLRRGRRRLLADC